MISTRFALIGVLGLVSAACGGGGGGGGGGGASDAFSLSAQSINFVATRRFVSPETQQLSLTLRTAVSGDLYVLVEVAGDAIGHVGAVNITSETSGYVNLFPANPSELSVGLHTSSITVRLCVNDPTCATGQLSGSPKVVTVNYDVRPHAVEADAVAPSVVMAGQAGRLILRGSGLSGANMVRLGGAMANAVTAVSDTELHVDHPALAAGHHDVVINDGALAFSGELTAVPEEFFAEETLPYPALLPDPQSVAPLRYDPRNRALYAVLTPTAGDNVLTKWVYDGGWSTPSATVLPGLRNVRPGPTRDSLLGFTRDAVVRIDPTTLTLLQTYRTPNFVSQYEYVNNLTFTNDGYAIVTFGFNGSGGTPIFFFSTSTNQFYQAWPDRWFGAPTLTQSGAIHNIATASRDGSKVSVGPLYQYDPSTGRFFFEPSGQFSNDASTTLDGKTKFSATDSGVVIGPAGPEGASLRVTP